MIDFAPDDLLADDRPKNVGTSEPARGLRPAVAHPTCVIQRLQHAKMLFLVCVEGVLARRRCQIVLVEPGP